MKKIYFITDHKTGTVWISSIMQMFQYMSKYIFFIKYSKSLIENIRYSLLKNNLPILLQKMNSNKKNIFRLNKIIQLTRADINIKSKKSPKVLIVRDPRDICISAAKYDGNFTNGEPQNADFFRYRKAIEGKTLEEIIIFQAKHNTLETLKRLKHFKDNYDCMVIKYEDLFQDIDNSFVLTKTIGEYVGFNDKEISLLINAYKRTHINNLGGVKTSHINSGLPEQYKSLSEETQYILNTILADYILDFGYKINNG